MTYYDNLNAFHKANECDPLPASAQLVFLHLLHKNNCLGNTGQFHCSDAELLRRSNLSAPTITQAKRILKNKGYLDFKTDKANPRAGTLYFLANHLSNHLGNHLGKDLGKDLGNPTEIISSDRSPHIKTKEGEVEEDAHATATNTPLSQNSKAVMDAWLMYEGEKLKGGYALDFIELENTYGTQELVDAIKAAAQSNTRPRLSYNFVKAVLLNQLKGGDKREIKVQREESKPEPRPSEQWADGLLAKIRQQRG